MSRKQLEQTVSNLLVFLNTPFASSALLSTCMSPTATSSIPYPGCTPDFAGWIQFNKNIYTGTTNHTATLLDSVIDETQGKVAFLTLCAGTHTGEFGGIPASGKPFNLKSFFSMKVDKETGLISELNIIAQDVVFLQQIGMLPSPA